MRVKNLKSLSLFVFFFALACERIFIKTYTIESRCLIGLENILSMHLSARGILQALAVMGLNTDFFKDVLLVEFVYLVFTDSLAT